VFMGLFAVGLLCLQVLFRLEAIRNEKSQLM